MIMIAVKKPCSQHRHPQTRTRNSKRHSEFLLSLACVFHCLICVCIAGSYEAERFSSSIVTRDEDVWPSRECDRPAERRALRIERSFVDRDPMYYGDDGQYGSQSDDEGGIADQHQDMFASFREERRRTNQWRSPLESVAPLPSFAREFDADATHALTQPPPTTIRAGPRHSHAIDLARPPARSAPPRLRTRSTGTTIVALVAANATVVVLAADTRATDGTTVADRRCAKLHALAGNVWCAGAGTSADVDALVRRVKFHFWGRGARTTEEGGGVGNMERSRRPSRGEWEAEAVLAREDREAPPAAVPAVLHHLRTQLKNSGGQLGVNLLAGGYDHVAGRARLAAVHPHGSLDVVTYAALGSGGLAATGVLEARYPRRGGASCSAEEGVRLAVAAVRAGVANDLGSGSQVDVCVIGREGVAYRRAVVREEELRWTGADGGGEGAAGAPAPRGNGTERDAGVNGFGNVPFAIQSRKYVSRGQAAATREQSRWLEAVLGEERPAQP